MLLASQIILILAGISLIADALLVYTRKPNPFKGYPLPCPNTLVLLGLGVILFSIASF